jgi:hypothetical protein
LSFNKIKKENKCALKSIVKAAEKSPGRVVESTSRKLLPGYLKASFASALANK